MNESVVAQTRTKTTWPIVFGILSFVIAGFYLLGTIVSLAICLNPDLENKPFVSIILGSSITLFLLIVLALLIFGGIFILLRKLVGRVILLVYSWILIGLMCASLIGFSLMFIITSEMPIWVLALNLTSISIHLIFPIFLVIWFSRRKIKEEVKSWAGPAEMEESLSESV